MSSGRSRWLLSHLIAGLCGVVLGITTAHWLTAQTKRAELVARSASAMESYEAGDYDRAIFFLGQAILEDPEDCVPESLLAKVYARKGNQQLALATYKKILEGSEVRCPAAERASIQMDFEALQMGLLVPDNPALWQVWSFYGAIYSHRGNQQLALRAYQKALNLCQERKCSQTEMDSIRKSITTSERLLSTPPPGSTPDLPRSANHRHTFARLT